MDQNQYTGKLRVRANGLLVDNDALLLVKLYSPLLKRKVWTPPGGGVDFKESMEATLVREFEEETGLTVDVGELQHINELIALPFHAIEFYYEVEKAGGTLRLGSDPERPETDQIIEEVRFISFSDFPEYSIEPEYIGSQFVDDYRDGDNTIRFSACS